MVQIAISYITFSVICALHFDLIDFQNQLIEEIPNIKKELYDINTEQKNTLHISTKHVLLAIILFILYYFGVFNMIYDWFFINEELKQDVLEEISNDITSSHFNRFQSEYYPKGHKN